MDTEGARQLNCSSPRCLNSRAQRTDFFHGLLRLGAGENTSPLYRLFQAFRRSNPHNRRAGGWSRILVVPDNDRAKSMAKRFEAGEKDYENDAKWWELVEEAEADAVRGQGSFEPGSGGKLGGESNRSPEEDDTPGTGEHSTSGGEEVSWERSRLPGLSQQYSDDLTGQRYEVEAFEVQMADPLLAASGCPWAIRRTAAGVWEFYVDTGAAAFRSMTLTPLDALLAELAWLTADFERGQQGATARFGSILAALRTRYATASMLTPEDMVAGSRTRLVDIARSIVGKISREDARAYFDDLYPSQQENIRVNMATRGVADPHGAIDDGRFLEYASPKTIRSFVLSNPGMFFDGSYWDGQYSDLDFGSSAATDEARARALDYYGGLLADAVWLAEQAPSDLETITRERLMRAFLATELLSRTGGVGEDN